MIAIDRQTKMEGSRKNHRFLLSFPDLNFLTGSQTEKSSPNRTTTANGICNRESNHSKPNKSRKPVIYAKMTTFMFPVLCAKAKCYPKHWLYGISDDKPSPNCIHRHQEQKIFDLLFSHPTALPPGEAGNAQRNTTAKCLKKDVECQ